ncbi:MULTISPECIES: ABC transporter permease [Variovorax]|jgi:ABC-type nitrate/sulfonate/bicarbonate transport system permease component|uniref:ABC transporter permease n=1 Tax=Variovorax TaxID=34072 RepID=UPI00120A3F37|nr:ABC transporter permease [Variovorax sp.]TAJ60337.1 MAG: ABC transporter permease [Variovorax sp.]
MSRARLVERWLPGTLAVVGVLAAWELLGRGGTLNPALLPAPSVVLATLVDVVRDDALAQPIARTLALMATGYLIACACGIALGVAMGRSEAVHALMEPLVELVRPIPKPALIPPLFLFLGIGLQTMLFIVVLAAFFPVLINTVQGVRGVDPVLLDTARTLRLTRRATVLRVVLPAALPMVATGMRVSLGLALTLVVVAEMLAGENGVGFLILDMQRAFQIQKMYAWLVVLALLGLLLNGAFEWAERRALPWRAHLS